jgi:hypothetical protein
MTVLRKSTVRPWPSVRAAVVEHLQQDVEDVRVGLLDLVHQDHAVGPAAHGLGQVAALLVADVAGRRADQPGHRVLLHELGHVDAHHGLFGVEQELGQRLAQLGLADAGGAEEQERADRPVRVRQPGAGAADGVGHGAHRLVLADHALSSSSSIAAACRARPRASSTPGCRSTWRRPRRLLVGDLVAQQLVLVALGLARRRRAASPAPGCAVLQLGHAREVAGAARGLHLDAGAVELLLDVGGALHAAFSDFQISSRSENSRSSVAIWASRSARRFFEASSDSFFSASRSILSWIRRRSSLSISSGMESISMRIWEAASSIRSMALSGSWRSVM